MAMSSEATAMDVETVVLDPIARIEKSIEDVEASIKKIENRLEILHQVKSKALVAWSTIERDLYTDHG
jgi:vacuolar-type H+-ATPase subunit I/STV1